MKNLHSLALHSLASCHEYSAEARIPTNRIRETVRSAAKSGYSVRPNNNCVKSLCLHVAGWRGGRVRALVELTLSAEPVVEVRGASPVPRPARPARPAARTRTLQRRTKFRRHFRAKRCLVTESQVGRVFSRDES